MTVPFLFFENENLANGLQGGANAPVQAGVNDTDSGTLAETAFGLPWMIDPEKSWLNHSCAIEISLDAGIAVHKPLPQGSAGEMIADSLGVTDVYDPRLAASANEGVRTVSLDEFADVAQKMATSSFTFLLRGWALRAGYQVPIPKLVSVAGARAIPMARQWAVNEVVGNYCGVPVFLAQWELWYTVTVPPAKNVLPPANLAMHIRADAQLPDELQVPYSPADSNAVRQPTQGQLQNIVTPPKPPAAP